MKTRSKQTIVLLACMLVINIQTALWASSNAVGTKSGQLKGELIDQSTRQPLISANVMIEGTQLGAATDSNGQYVIGHIPPGIYNIRYMMMGYETRVANQVVVNPGRTTWQQIEMKATLLESEGVTVTAGYFQSARDAVVSSRSVDYQEMRADPGSVEDIQRVMQALPAVVSGGDGSNEILVRGGMPGENLFLMDDIEIPNPNHFADQGTSGGPINMVDPNFIRQVDFYAGAFPARYGDKASSVMDISLREGDRDHMTGHAFFDMSGAGMIMEGPLNHGKGSYIFSARRSYLDLILSNIGMNAIPHYYSFQSKCAYDLDKDNKIIFNALYGNDNIEGEDEDEYIGLPTDVWHWKQNSNQKVFGLGWRRLMGSKGYVKTTLSQVQAQWDVWERKNSRPDYKNVSTEGERTLKTEWTYLPAPSLELQLGAQVKYVNFDISQWVKGDTIFLYQPDGAGNVPLKQVFQAYNDFNQKKSDTSYKYALFMQGKWHPAARWTFSAGLRGDYFQFIKDSALDPRLGLSYQISPLTSINLAVGQQSQTPSYVQISANPLNHDLDYKQTRQAVLGFEHLFREDTRGTLEIFYKDYKKVPIGLDATTIDPFDDSDGRGVSQGEGFAKGVELFLQKKPTGHTHFTISYAYSIARARDPRTDHYYNWDYDYRHIFTAIGGIQLHLKDKRWYQQLGKNWLYKVTAWLLPLGDEVEISCRWRYLGGRPYTRPNYHPELLDWVVDENVELNAHRFPAYHRLDIRLDRRFMFNGWNIVAYMDIINVYNKKNIWDYYYKRDGTVGSYDQFSFLPVGGLSVEF
jgi:outer membrane receptor protein involved in Fe transport